MIKIIQNIKELSSKVIALVLANKGLSIGIATFVVLATVGGVYLYSSNLGPNVKQTKINDVSLFGRISEGVSKLSPVQKFGLASAMPVLIGLYRVLNTPEEIHILVEQLVYHTRNVVPTRIQAVFFSRISKVFASIVLLTGFGAFTQTCVGPIVLETQQNNATNFKVLKGKRAVVTDFLPNKIKQLEASVFSLKTGKASANTDLGSALAARTRLIQEVNSKQAAKDAADEELATKYEVVEKCKTEVEKCRRNDALPAQAETASAAAAGNDELLAQAETALAAANANADTAKKAFDTAKVAANTAQLAVETAKVSANTAKEKADQINTELTQATTTLDEFIKADAQQKSVYQNVDYYFRFVVPFVLQKVSLMFSLCYEGVLNTCLAISKVSANWFYAWTVPTILAYLVCRFDVPYFAQFLRFVMALAQRAYLFANPIWKILSLCWNTLQIQTYEDTYLGAKLVGTRLIKSVPVNHPFVDLTKLR